MMRKFASFALIVLFAFTLLGCSQEQNEKAVEHDKTEQQSKLLPTGVMAYLALTDGYWEVWLHDFNKGTSEPLTQYGSDVSGISWYPDGKHLFINTHDGRFWKRSTADGNEEEIIAPMGNILDAALSPDGTKIAFSLSTADSIDNNDIWIFDIESEQLTKLTSMSRLQHEPTWSNDGAYVYFLSGDGGQTHDIWRVNISTKATEQITVNEGYHFDIALNTANDLAYSGNKNGNYDIWIRQNKQELRSITDDQALDARPDWSPDAQWLLFQSTRGDQGIMNIWLYKVSDASMKQVTEHLGGARHPVFAPNGGSK